MKHKAVITFLLYYLLTLRAFAQTPQYQFTRLDIDQGLSSSQINCIYKDSKGFIWFGTMSGLNRYDGYTFRVFKHDLRDSTSLPDNFIERITEGPGGLLWIYARDGQHIYDPASGTFRRNPQPVLQQLGIPGGNVNDIIRDSLGQFWFIHPTAGLYCYIPGSRQTIRVQHIAQDSSSICDNTIAAITPGNDGSCWVLHNNGILEKMDGRSRRVVFRNDHLYRQNQGAPSGYALMADREGDLWIYNTREAQGIWYFNRDTHAFLHYDQNSGPIKLNNNIVRGVVQDNQGLIWVGTDHGGVNIINKQRQSIHYVQNLPESPKSLSQNSITTLYKDNTGIIWVGTYKKGVSYYHENIVKFPLYQHQPFETNSLPYDDVNRFVEDAAGNLWIGTNGGGLIYFNRHDHTFTQYRHDPHNPGSLSSDVVVSLFIDHAQKLWVGTYFGGLDRFDGGRFVHYTHDPAKTGSLSNNSVWEIFEDSRHHLWIGTLGGGLNLYDPTTQTFRTYRREQPNSIHSNYIAALLEDKQGNLWIGTDNGVDVRHPQTGRFTAYANDPRLPHTLSNNNVISLFEDSRGWIWIGTREGLNLFDPQQRQFRIFRKEEGLPDNTVLNILEDQTHTLWISTPNGLSNLSISWPRNSKEYTFSFRNYDASDGLQGAAFNENAALSTKRGELIFGGSNGFNLFYPHTITQNKNVPPLVLTDLQIFNKSISAGEKINGRVLLQQDITETKQLTLKYKENVFSITFAALSYFHPEKSRYAYKLEGFNQEWLTTGGNQRVATYTNLDPGEYVFRVKASNNDGVWTQQPLELHIRILPPFWRTPLAFTLYALLIIAALLLARRLMLERERLRFRIEQERQQAQRMHELDALKIRFFTNVSHEFRTPLSLIITPLEKIIKTTAESNIKGQLELIQRNARRLLNLVNQLLDFRKMEVQEIKLHTATGDIVHFIRELTTSFSDLSEKKQVQLDFRSNVSSLPMQYDADKIEKIIFNLLSNAFKFTPEHGSIAVELQLQENNILCIIVKDTGIGIPLEQQERIFDRFFQHEGQGSLLNQGSGIGLSITKEFVKLHGGVIMVDSAPEMGSCFTILLPVSTGTVIPAINTPTATTIITPRPANPAGITEPDKRSGKKPLVLLVEDNEDFRFYLKDNLGQHYHIITAENGQTAWKILQQQLPDLVVSDVSMPVMDGLELCRRIRGHHPTAHIPIILLTARTTEADQLEALERGATDFITKPFNFEVLLSRIRNLISQQDLLKKSFRKHITANPSEIAISSADELFIQQALQIVEKHMSDPGFSVEELSRELHMSRVSAYKKILSLTGKTPIEFIRSIRLKRAAALLEKSQLTVAEVAYEVGFNNPKYFTKYFKMEYNVLPSAYGKQQHGTDK